MSDLSVWIERHAARTPDRTAIVFEGTVTSYRAFAARVAFLAGVLSAQGTTAGDRVALLSTNHPDYLALLFACARLGAILVPLNWRLAPAEHAQILADAEPRVLISERSFAAGLADRAPLGIDTLDTLPTMPCARAGRPDLPLLLVYTSGTTGRAKGAVLTQNAVAWNAVNSQQMHDMTARDRVLTFLPMFHVGGLNIQTVPALALGAEIVLMRKFEPGEALAAIGAMRPTLSLVVPAVMKAMIEHPAWAIADLSSLRMLGAGSSIVPVDLIRAFHARGVPVAQVYGATETGPIAIYQKREDALVNEGSTGQPALNCEARLDDGEILVRGPNVATGYWRDPEATRAAFTNGWFRTGDLGRIDSDGNWWVDERKKDMIISGGENVYPAEIEAALSAHPAVAECAAVAKPDARWGEVPVVFIVKRPGAEIDAAALRAFLDGRLARFKWPKAYRFVDVLPRNAMGKVRRFELRAQAREGGE
ncbi:MAG: long-chain fatty acid--CoA ligase [Proteobacteria bacterium]|nr:long-chain fatty acid--CoA ligase [Pseudomonadota bacterium]